MKRALAVASLVAGSFGCFGGVVGNGQVVQQTRSLSGFTQVDLRGTANVHVSQASDFSVTVTTDSNVQPVVETTVSGDTLVIDERFPGTISVTRLDVDVTLPDFRGGTLDGSGNFDASSVNQPQDAAMTLSGSGDMTLQGSVGALTAVLSGSGNLKLTGTANSLSASATGSGGIDGEGMQVNDGTLSLDGSGNLSGTVENTVSLHLTGSGNIDWWGPAAVTSTVDTGSGNIAHH